MIGKDWLSVRNGNGQLRLSDPDDFVGLEISLALQRNVLVIPILVGGAKMPQAKELPSQLKPLAQRNAVILNDQDFQRVSDALIQALERIPGLRETSSGASVDARNRLQLGIRSGKKIWGRADCPVAGSGGVVVAMESDA